MQLGKIAGTIKNGLGAAPHAQSWEAGHFPNFPTEIDDTGLTNSKLATP